MSGCEKTTGAPGSGKRGTKSGAGCGNGTGNGGSAVAPGVAVGKIVGPGEGEPSGVGIGEGDGIGIEGAWLGDGSVCASIPRMKQTAIATTKSPW